METERIQEFFFTAMREGWAAGAEMIKIEQMPGHKAFSFREGDFDLLDCYSVTPGSLISSGTTTIWVRSAPVWVMHYRGEYRRTAIPFLKRVLLKSYQAQQFVGGRGPIVSFEDPFVYTNQTRTNDFLRFEGREEVYSTAICDSLGFHEYWGMSLF